MLTFDFVKFALHFLTLNNSVLIMLTIHRHTVKSLGTNVRGFRRHAALAYECTTPQTYVKHLFNIY